MRLQKQFAISLGLGLIAFGLVCIAAWQQLSGPPPRLSRQGQVQSLVREIQWRLSKYMEDHEERPSRLADLDFPDSYERDPWGHPLQFHFEGNTPVVFSLGRDGLPGGRGPDADLYSDDRNRAETPPTLAQFLTVDAEHPASGFLFDGLVTAGIVTVTVFLMLRRQSRRPEWISLRQTIFEIVVMTGFAIFWGICLLFLHIPSGH